MPEYSEYDVQRARILSEGVPYRHNFQHVVRKERTPCTTDSVVRSTKGTLLLNTNLSMG